MSEVTNSCLAKHYTSAGACSWPLTLSEMLFCPATVRVCIQWAYEFSSFNDYSIHEKSKNISQDVPQIEY